MKFDDARERAQPNREIVVSGVTLIALGLSIFILDGWSNLFVRLFVGLFWSAFFLILNGPNLVQKFRKLSRSNAEQRGINGHSSTYPRRLSSY